MNRYDKNEKCPKCGSSDINDRFLGLDDYKNYHRVAREHIERHCRNCQYEWKALPFDSKEATERNTNESK